MQLIRSTVVLLVTMLIVSCNQRTNKEERDIYRGKIVFADTIRELGRFSVTNPIHASEFTFKNTGTVPVVILHVEPSCRCITTEYSQEVVHPGEDGKITVVFDGSKSQPGYFDKSVRVRINSPRIYTLRVKGLME